MAGKKKSGGKKDPAKEAAKQARKALKQEKSSVKRSGKDLEEQDIEVLLAEAATREASRTEVTAEVVQKSDISPRCNSTLTTVGTTNEMFLFGGERYDGSVNTVFNELYRWRVALGEWTKIASPNSPQPRCSHQAVALSSGGRDQLYVFGGEFATLAQFYHYRDLWRFDPKTMAWEQLAKNSKERGPSARSGHRCVNWRGQILLFGGFFKAHNQEPRWYNDVWLYSPANDAWTEVEFSTAIGVVKPPPRSGCVFQVHGDAALVYGGYSEVKSENMIKAKGKEHVDAWMLQLTAGKSSKTLAVWERCNAKGRAPSPRVGVASAIKGDQVYVFGGVHDVDGEGLQTTSTFYAELYVFDLSSKRWRSVSLKPEGDDTDDKQQSNRQRKIAASEQQTEDEEEEDDDDDDEEAAPEAWDETKAESAITDKRLTSPPARICSTLTVREKLLYVVGGVLEVGEKEVVLDDCWSLDLKGKQWKCLETGTMHKHVWKEEVIEEEAEEEDEPEEDEEEDDDDDDDETKDDETKEESKGGEEGTSPLAPLAGEALRAFFDRTREHWLVVARRVGGEEELSEKDAKRAGFTLASEHYELNTPEEDADAPPPPPAASSSKQAPKKEKADGRRKRGA